MISGDRLQFLPQVSAWRLFLAASKLCACQVVTGYVGPWFCVDTKGNTVCMVLFVLLPVSESKHSSFWLCVLWCRCTVISTNAYNWGPITTSGLSQGIFLTTFDGFELVVNLLLGTPSVWSERYHTPRLVLAGQILKHTCMHVNRQILMWLPTICTTQNYIQMYSSQLTDQIVKCWTKLAVITAAVVVSHYQTTIFARSPFRLPGVPNSWIFMRWVVQSELWQLWVHHSLSWPLDHFG